MYGSFCSIGAVFLFGLWIFGIYSITFVRLASFSCMGHFVILVRFFILVYGFLVHILSHLCLLFHFGVRIFSFRFCSIYVVSFGEWVFWYRLYHICARCLLLVFGSFGFVSIRLAHVVLFTCTGACCFIYLYGFPDLNVITFVYVVLLCCAGHFI